MKLKLILCLALVLSGGFILSRADETNAIASPTTVTQQRIDVVSFSEVLQESGVKLGCHFTLEYRGYAMTGKVSKIAIGEFIGNPVTTDLRADSLPALISNLRNYLEDFVVMQDSKNPKIVHIIEKVLANDTDYALNRKISVNYSGLLSGTNVLNVPIDGYATVVGGLLPAIAEKVPDIKEGAESAGGGGGAGGLPWDSATRINVNATNETVRSIFTDCLPAANYNTIMWTAVTTKVGGSKDSELCVLVHFYGPKKP